MVTFLGSSAVLLALLAVLLLFGAFAQVQINTRRDRRDSLTSRANKAVPSRPAGSTRELAAEFDLPYIDDDGLVILGPPATAESVPAEPRPDTLLSTQHLFDLITGDEVAFARYRQAVEEAERRLAERRRADERKAEYGRLRAARDEWLATWCEPATAEQYAIWLRAWILNGGQTGPDRDYDMSAGDWFVLRPGVVPTTPPACHGALAFDVLVPAGSLWPPAAVAGRVGHSSFFWMDHQGRPGMVGPRPSAPTYRDVRAALRELSG